MNYQDGPHIFLKENDAIEIINFHHSSNDPIQFETDQGFFQKGEYLLNYQDFPIKLKKNNAPAESLYPLTGKIAAIGDIHGEYDILIKLLVNNGIINHQFDWTWGKNHLVFCGDLFDRGTKVTECLWLIYYLEQEAAKAGGELHYLLGNHEHMAMTADYRYLAKKYKKIYSNTSLDYADLFSQKTLLGQWLRMKNAVVKIGPYLFVHAGISPALADLEYSVEKINNDLHQHLASNSNSDPDFVITGPQGPLWYRGYLIDWQFTGKITDNEVDRIREFYQVKKIIFAHTNVPQIRSFCNQKLFAIDIPIEEELDNAQALIIEDDNFYAADLNGKKILVP